MLVWASCLMTLLLVGLTRRAIARGTLRPARFWLVAAVLCLALALAGVGNAPSSAHGLHPVAELGDDGD